MLDASFSSAISGTDDVDKSFEYEDRDCAVEMLTDHCFTCLSHLSFYEAGLIASESSAKAILSQVCRKDANVALQLMEQVRIIINAIF